MFQRPATQQALISLLLHVLNDPAAHSQLVSSLKKAITASLSDDKFRSQLASNLRQLLRDENTRQGLLELVAYIFRDDSMKRETERFFQEVLASNRVRQEATKLGKDTVKDVFGDKEVQKKTGDAMWSAFTYSVTPRLFSGGNNGSQKVVTTNSDGISNDRDKVIVGAKRPKEDGDVNGLNDENNNDQTDKTDS